MDDIRLQFQALLPSTIRHRRSLGALELRSHELEADDVLLRAEGQPQRLYFVANGWLSLTTAMLEGVRPIGALKIRGDLVGLSWIDRPNHLEDATTLTPVELISVRVEDFRSALSEDAVLQDFVRNELSRDLMNLRLLSAVIGHMKAPDRLAYFLFILLNRYRRTYQTRLDTLLLPLTQQQIGKILGLTNVSVNRAYRSLEADGLIRTGRQSVTFIDEEAAARRFDFHTRPDLLEQLAGARI